MIDITRGMRQGLWGLWLALGCALLGCGGDARGSAVEATGGMSTQTGNDDDDSELCKVQPLSAACPEDRQCPASPDDVPLVCSSPNGTSRSATKCGGTMVSVSQGLGASTWYFDADGTLVGLRSISDIGPDCGGNVPATIYGEVCERVGEPEDLCLATCYGKPPLSEDGAELTEQDYDFEAQCTRLGPYQVTQAATLCGGKLYKVELEDGSIEHYCFDSAGLLIGRSREDVEGEVADMEGATCLPDGRIEPQCDVNPG